MFAPIVVLALMFAPLRQSIQNSSGSKLLNQAKGPGSTTIRVFFVNVFSPRGLDEVAPRPYYSYRLRLCEYLKNEKFKAGVACKNKCSLGKT
jgi:hypothetical protein